MKGARVKPASNEPRANLDEVAPEFTKRCSKLRVDAFYVWKAAPVQPGDVIYHFVSALVADSGLQLLFHVEGDPARPFQVNLLECSSPIVMRDLVVFESALAVRLPSRFPRSTPPRG